MKRIKELSLWFGNKDSIEIFLEKESEILAFAEYDGCPTVWILEKMEETEKVKCIGPMCVECSEIAECGVRARSVVRIKTLGGIDTEIFELLGSIVSKTPTICGTDYSVDHYFVSR